MRSITLTIAGSRISFELFNLCDIATTDLRFTRYRDSWVDAKTYIEKYGFRESILKIVKYFSLKEERFGLQEVLFEEKLCDLFPQRKMYVKGISCLDTSRLLNTKEAKKLRKILTHC